MIRKPHRGRGPGRAHGCRKWARGAVGKAHGSAIFVMRRSLTATTPQLLLILCPDRLASPPLPHARQQPPLQGHQAQPPSGSAASQRGLKAAE